MFDRGDINIKSSSNRLTELLLVWVSSILFSETGSPQPPCVCFLRQDPMCLSFALWQDPMCLILPLRQHPCVLGICNNRCAAIQDCIYTKTDALIGNNSLNTFLNHLNLLISTRFTDYTSIIKNINASVCKHIFTSLFHHNSCFL